MGPLPYGATIVEYEIGLSDATAAFAIPVAVSVAANAANYVYELVEADKNIVKETLYTRYLS